MGASVIGCDMVVNSAISPFERKETKELYYERDMSYSFACSVLQMGKYWILYMGIFFRIGADDHIGIYTDNRLIGRGMVSSTGGVVF